MRVSRVLLQALRIRSGVGSARVVDELGDNLDEFSGLVDDRIVHRGQQISVSQHTKPEVRLHEFAEHDSPLREFVAWARSAIGLFVVDTGRRAALENLIRKCTGYATTSVQELHQPDDNARVEKQPLA